MSFFTIISLDLQHTGFRTGSASHARPQILLMHACSSPSFDIVIVHLRAATIVTFLTFNWLPIRFSILPPAHIFHPPDTHLCSLPSLHSIALPSANPNLVAFFVCSLHLPPLVPVQHLGLDTLASLLPTFSPSPGFDCHYLFYLNIQLLRLLVNLSIWSIRDCFHLLVFLHFSLAHHLLNICLDIPPIASSLNIVWFLFVFIDDGLFFPGISLRPASPHPTPSRTRSTRPFLFTDLSSSTYFSHTLL